MYSDSADNELYILNRSHLYESGACTVCGDREEGETRTVSGKVRDGEGAGVSIGKAETRVNVDGTFSLPTVEGVWDMVVKKEGCLTYTVKGITVGEGDILLPEIELVAGDVNGDDMINIMDIGAFRENFGMADGEITNIYTDVNNDDMVNIIDMGIFRRNFGKTAAKDCTVTF